MKYKVLANEVNIATAISYSFSNNQFKNNISLIDRNGNIQLTYLEVHICKFRYKKILTPRNDFYVRRLVTTIEEVKVGAMIYFE